MDAFGKTFTYDGKSLTDFDAIMCSFDSQDTMRDVLSYTVNKGEITPDRPTPNAYNKAYVDVLTFGVGICKCYGEEFSETERNQIVRWITAPLPYRKFVIQDSEEFPYHGDTEYFVTCTSYKNYIPNSAVRGMYFEFECNAPYGFSPEESTSFSSSNPTVTINNQSDETFEDYYPTIELTGNTTGEVTITNSKFPSEVMRLQVRQTQKLTIDCKMGNITDNMDLFDYATDTNLVWLRLSPGENTITVTGNAAGKIKCRYPRKVGI